MAFSIPLSGADYQRVAFSMDVLILNEGAMTRIVGIGVGVLVIIELLALQGLIGFMG